MYLMVFGGLLIKRAVLWLLQVLSLLVDGVILVIYVVLVLSKIIVGVAYRKGLSGYVKRMREKWDGRG
jgi:hypothetical protein